jgi:2-phospho-L-lactate/phosphoenolpyruvate guanylyltransferase
VVPVPDRPSPDREGPTGWVVVLPVKHARHGKRRLQGDLGDRVGTDRSALARAIAADALSAARACRVVRSLVVVTGDPVIAELARSAGDEVVRGDDQGLDAAVRVGLDRAARRWPGLGRAVLLADVPALQPQDLEDALLAAAAYPRSFVADQEGTGTVLLAARQGVEPRPAFGAGSAARHERLGAVRLDLDLPRLRRDVDTADDLRDAAELGVGPATQAVLNRSGLA